MQKINFKPIVVVLISLVLLVNCSKNDNETQLVDAHLEMKMNGELKKFNNSLSAQTAYENDKIVTLIVAGLKDPNPGETDSFDIHIVDIDNGITTRTFLNPVNNNLNYDLYSNYFNNLTNKYFSSSYNDPQEFKVIITGLANNCVKGTFSGKIRKDNNQEVIIITEGSFIAPIEN
ncbi:hypothetical protein [Flavobacterium sp. FlaQc-28]|uniref:hypothetical protein n=1 Tax=Flavobacterium sp. FlaQc-28 TaxID=3374178 RepID=UPI003757AD0D